jgi:hypothetical protein
VPLGAALRQALRERWKGCLCSACLHLLAQQGPGGADGAVAVTAAVPSPSARTERREALDAAMASEASEPPGSESHR